LIKKLGFQLFILLGTVVVGIVANATIASLANRYNNRGFPYDHGEMEDCCGSPMMGAYPRTEERSGTSFVSTERAAEGEF